MSDGTARAVLDLGHAGRKHSQLSLQVDGTDFMRHTRIERSDNEKTWDLLAQGQIVFRVTSSPTPRSQLVVSYPVSDARYVRISLLPIASAGVGFVRITGAQLSFAPTASKPPTRTLAAKLGLAPAPPRPGVSSFVFDAGVSGVPFSSTVFDVDTAAFERAVQVFASDDGQIWIPQTAGWLHKASGTSSLSLELGQAPRRLFRLDVQDGDNASLNVAGAQLSYQVEQLVFEAHEPGSYELLFGAKGQPPDYDLAAIVAREGSGAFRSARFGSVHANSVFGVRAPASLPWTETHSAKITFALVLVLAALAVWTVRLVRR